MSLIPVWKSGARRQISTPKQDLKTPSAIVARTKTKRVESSVFSGEINWKKSRGKLADLRCVHKKVQRKLYRESGKKEKRKKENRQIKRQKCTVCVLFLNQHAQLGYSGDNTVKIYKVCTYSYIERGKDGLSSCPRKQIKVRLALRWIKSSGEVVSLPHNHATVCS